MFPRFAIVVVFALASPCALAQTNLRFFPFSQWDFLFSAYTVGDVIGSPVVDRIGVYSASDPLYATTQLVLRPFDGTADSEYIDIPGMSHVERIVVVDVDGDQDRDILLFGKASAPNYDESLGLVTKSASGWSIAYRTLGAPSFAQRVADIDADGDADVLCGKTILLNDGSGGFAAEFSLPLPQIPISSVAGDFDGDGDLDLAVLVFVVVGQNSGAWIQIFERSATGNYLPSTVFQAETAATFGSLECGDMNGDGIDDLLVGAAGVVANPYTQATAVTAGTITVFVGIGNLGFNALTSLPLTALRDLQTTIVDFDQDGDLDCVGSSGTPFYLVNDGQGLLTPATGDMCLMNGYLRPRYAPIVANLDADPELEVTMAYVSSAPVPWGAGGYWVFNPLVPQATTAVPSFSPPTSTSLTAGRVATVRFVVTSSAGSGSLPSVGHVVDVQLSPGSTQARCLSLAGPTLSTSTVAASYAGEGGLSTADVVIDTGAIPGPITLTATLASGASVATTLTIDPDVTTVVITQGNHQTTAPQQVFPLPLTVHLDPVGVSNVGLPVTFTSIGSTPVTLSANTVMTDASGQAAVFATAGTSTGSAMVRAEWSVYSAVFDLTVSLPSVVPLAAIAGDQQAVTTGESFPLALSVAATSPNGLPNVGATIAFNIIAGTAVLSAPNAITNALGEAAVTVTTNGNYRGAITVRATLGADFVDFQLFARGLTTTALNPTTRVFNYRHEHAGVPLLVMFDVPLAAPGFVSTPFGNVATSILAPQPTLFVLDGFGIFGPANPSLVVGGANLWQQVFTGLPTLGLTLVAQVAFWDLAYPYPQTLGLSNAVTFNL